MSLQYWSVLERGLTRPPKDNLILGLVPLFVFIVLLGATPCEVTC